ncbi:hypothetical protein [Larkinella terrae]|uniref:Uncharacterized protein n=1 Tax=Larkinella terrae TaxID=2025311 RepID=A0A7K0EIX4_9BACT|nr:hypothetical protein [Larkinella terrae]MRS61810.1 hypothetical protein [Larkinella terrae]
MKDTRPVVSAYTDIAHFGVLDSSIGAKKATPDHVRSVLGLNGEMVARDVFINGMLLESDPVSAVLGSTDTPASGTAQMSRVIAPYSGAVTKVWFVITGTVGSGLSGTGGNGIGLYATDGTRLAWADCTTAFTGSGIISASLDVTVNLVAGTEYRLVLVSTGTTRATYRCASQGFAINAGITGVARFSTKSSQTLTTTLSMTGWSASTAHRIWIGLSA